MADARSSYGEQIETARTALSRGDRPAAAAAFRSAIDVARGDAGLQRELLTALVQLGKLEQELGHDPNDLVNPSAHDEAFREAHQGRFHETVDDANDVLLAPFAGLIDSNSAWVNHGVPALRVICGVFIVYLLCCLACSSVRGGITSRKPFSMGGVWATIRATITTPTIGLQQFAVGSNQYNPAEIPPGFRLPTADGRPQSAVSGRRSKPLANLREAVPRRAAWSGRPRSATGCGGGARRST